MIEAVTYDWWHTIAETPWPDYDERMRGLRVEAVRGTLAAHGLLLDADVVYRAYDRHTDLLARAWRDRVDLTAEEQVGAFLDLAGVRPRRPSLEAAVMEAFGQAIRTKPPVLYPHIDSTLARLREEGYVVGLVSNTGRTWGRFLRPLQDELGIGQHFDTRVFSDEVRVRKPRREIFQVALSAIDVEPDRVLHIGDDVDADVRGAKALGLHAVWFNTGFWPEARADLADAEIHDHAELPDVLSRWRA